MLTRWMSGSSPVRYLRNSATLFSRAATSPRFSSSLRLTRAARLVLVPLKLFTRLHRYQANGFSVEPDLGCWLYLHAST